MNFTEEFLDAYKKIVEENLLLKQQLEEKNKFNSSHSDYEDDSDDEENSSKMILQEILNTLNCIKRKYVDGIRKPLTVSQKEPSTVLQKELKEEPLTVPQKEPEEDIYSLDYINKNILKENRFTNDEIDMLVKYKQVNNITNSSNAHKIYTLRHLTAILNKIDTELRINPNYFVIDNDRNLRNQIEFIPVIWKYVKKFGYDVKFYLKKENSRFYYDELNHFQIQEISAEKIFDTPTNWRYCQFHFTKIL